MLPDRVDTRLAAKAATGGNGAEAMDRSGFGRHRRCERDVQNVSERSGQARVLQFCQVRPGTDQSFREEETGGQFLIVSRRAHGDRQRVVAEPDFERLFHGNLIGDAFETPVVFPADNIARPNGVWVDGERSHIVGFGAAAHLGAIRTRLPA